MSTKRDYRSLTGSFRSIEELRETYRPGCQPHFIQCKVAHSRGRFETGVLLGVDGSVADVWLRRTRRVSRVGTLWPDRMARVALSDIRRDADGRPRIRWNRRIGVLQFYDREGYPTFNVVDLDRKPEYLAAWARLRASAG